MGLCLIMDLSIVTVILKQWRKILVVQDQPGKGLFLKQVILEQFGPVHLPKGTHGRQKAPANFLEYANHGNLTSQFSRNPLLFPKMTNMEMKI